MPANAGCGFSCSIDIHTMFIAGLTRLWAKPQSGENQYWFQINRAARGYHENERLIDIYENDWPNQYFYQITADSDLCRPLG